MKILPIVAATAFSIGTLASCSGLGVYNNKSDGTLTHYGETRAKLNNTLDSLDFAKSKDEIKFEDYYYKSNEAIKEAQLDENKLKKDAESGEGRKNSRNNAIGLSILLGALAGIGAMASCCGIDNHWADGHHYSCREKRTKYKKMAEIIAASLAGLSIAAVNVNAYTKKPEKLTENYIEDAKENFNYYKNQRAKRLDTLKDEYFKHEQIKSKGTTGQ